MELALQQIGKSRHSLDSERPSNARKRKSVRSQTADRDHVQRGTHKTSPKKQPKQQQNKKKARIKQQRGASSPPTPTTARALELTPPESTNKSWRHVKHYPCREPCAPSRLSCSKANQHTIKCHIRRTLVKRTREDDATQHRKKSVSSPLLR